MEANLFQKKSSGFATKEYRGLTIYQSWNPSNYHGTISHTVTLPNGVSHSSPSWDNLKKKIRKYFSTNQ